MKKSTFFGFALFASTTPGPSGGCSMPQEACTTAADCCDPGHECIHGFCAVSAPR